MQSFQWLHSRQSRGIRLLDDLGHPIRDPLRFLADLIFDPDLNVFIRFDSNLRSRSKVIPCPIEGARPVDRVMSRQKPVSQQTSQAASKGTVVALWPPMLELPRVAYHHPRTSVGPRASVGPTPLMLVATLVRIGMYQLNRPSRTRN